MEFKVPKSLVVIVIVKFEVLSKSPISGLIFRPTLSIIMVQIFLEWSVVVIRGTMYGGAQEELRRSSGVARSLWREDAKSKEIVAPDNWGMLWEPREWGNDQGKAMGASRMRHCPRERNGSLGNEATPMGTLWEPHEQGKAPGTWSNLKEDFVGIASTQATR
jgi:hypothetical protein